MIHIKNISLQIEGQNVLRDISTQIPASGLTAIIGPNGAGKSSLLHCIAGLTRAQQGQVMIDDTCITTTSPQNRAKIVALLSQANVAQPRLSVQDLVSFGRWPHHQGRPGKVDHACVDEAMRSFDLAHLAQRRVATLSGGQRQRAYIAMAYAQATPWMLLDEPLAALDPRYARDIMDRLRQLSRPTQGSRNIIVVLHDLAMTAMHADWVVSLKDGKLIQSAPRAEVMTSRNLSDLFETDIQIEDVRGRQIPIIA